MQFPPVECSFLEIPDAEHDQVLILLPRLGIRPDVSPVAEDFENAKRRSDLDLIRQQLALPDRRNQGHRPLVNLAVGGVETRFSRLGREYEGMLSHPEPDGRWLDDSFF